MGKQLIKKKWLRSPIAQKLIFYTIAFSSAITIVTTGIQLYREYRIDIDVIKREFNQVNYSFRESISNSLWLLEHKQIETQLRGILRLRDITYVSIIENGVTSYQVGDENTTSKVDVSFPLLHEYNGHTIQLGTIYVASSLEGVYERLLNRVWVILISNAVKTFAIAIFISFLFMHLVSRHLYAIANFTRTLNIGEHSDKLILNRKSSKKDELDEVVDSLHTMYLSAQQAMAESEDNRKIFEDYARSSSDWYWQIGSDLKFTYISPNYQILTGNDPALRIGKYRWEADDTYTEQEFWREHKELLERHEPFHRFEYHETGKDGKQEYYSVSGVPIFNTDGEFEGYRGTARIITDFKQLEKQLIHAQKLDAVGRLTGGIAHDYNNMLSIILGNIELLEIVTDLQDKEKEYLTNAKEAAQRSVGLTRKLLGFSRISSRNIIPVSVNEVILGVENLISKSLTASIQVDTHVASDIWITAVDQSDLEDCLINLSINARDAMPAGGVLTITTSNTTLESDAIPINETALPGEYVLISVSDTGIGMEKDVVSQIFEPFYTTKVKGKGTGLGLNMVLNFVRQSKGFITVNSELNTGTCFKIYLPRYYQTHEKTKNSIPTENKSGYSSGNETILIVDDEAKLLLITEKWLSKLGYVTLTAKNGDEAITIIEENPNIDLLFCDVIMPGQLNGFELGLAALHIRPNLNLVITSGYADPETIKAFSNDPVIGKAVRNMLRKPYNLADLSATIRASLDS